MKGMVALTRQEKVKALVEAFANEDYGTTVEHLSIANLIGERYGTQRYAEIVAAASKELIDCGKMITNVRGVGYRVIDPDEYTEQSAKRVVRGARQISKGERILENAPVKDMTQLGVQQYNAVTDRLRILKAAVTGAKVEIKMLTAKRENPLKQLR